MEVTTHSVEAVQSNGSNRKIRIVQISDLHLHGVADRDERLAEQIRDLNADAIVFTGDIIDRAENLEPLAAFLSALGSSPRFAVLGNWEYWSKVDLKRLRAIYESAPQSSLLVNQKAMVMLKGREIEFIGLDDFTAGKPDRRLLRSQSSSFFGSAGRTATFTRPVRGARAARRSSKPDLPIRAHTWWPSDFVWSAVLDPKG